MNNISIYINKATDGYVAELQFGDSMSSVYFIATNHDDLLRKVSNYINTLEDLETE
jgi:hypothetical protein